MQSKKLLLTGSHAETTAVAVIQEIKKRNLDWEIHWLGEESKNLTNLGVVNHIFKPGKVENKFTRNTIPRFFKIPADFVNGRKLIREINPDLTLSFGSSAGAISSFWSNFYGIPVIVHEQTATAGRANLISSYFAKKILISRESSLKFFSKNKTELIGNPLNSEIFKYLDLERNKRIKSILITGGSRGSTWINSAVFPLLPQLLEKYFILHQTGEKNLDKFKTVVGEKYLSFGQVSPREMIEVISKSDLIISRAGANTVSELIALKKPSILIPIPWSYNDEQQKNAEFMQELKLARILPQGDLTAQKLLSEIDALVEDYPAILKRTENIISPDLTASKKLVEILLRYI
ncbi:MAG TPA: glycosyltransferase [Patescibacteria group bacterium]|nr:glycosyltransferase [Patescibacteria group bacterium]